MSMFSNYQYIPENYQPSNRHKKPLADYPPSKPHEEYNIRGELIGYSWQWGDSVDLIFNIEGDVHYDDHTFYQSAGVYLQDKQLKLSIFNFRYELVKMYIEPAIRKTDERAEVVFTINAEESVKLVKGVYFASLCIVDEANKTQYTVFEPKDCNLMVK